MGEGIERGRVKIGKFILSTNNLEEQVGGGAGECLCTSMYRRGDLLIKIRENYFIKEECTDCMKIGRNV